MKHTGVFMGSKERRTYYCFSAKFEKYQFLGWGMQKPKIVDETSFIEYIEIDTQEILNPPFKAGESVYFESENKKYTVSEVARNTKGDYVYFLNKTVEIVEDKDTKESKEKAENKYEEEMVKFKEYQKEYERLSNKQSEKDIKKWWQFWKMS